MPIEIAAGQDAINNLASLPANVMLYGPPGSEKTTDAVKAFCKDGRCTAFVIPCEDGALKPILARGLPVPDHVRQPVKSWQEMTETLNWLGQNRNRYNAVIIDTISTFCAYLYKETEKQFENNKNKFLIPQAMRNYLYVLREFTRYIGLHCVLVAHGSAPEMKEGVFYRGGPLMSPKSMIEQYHGLIDTVLRVDWVQIPGQNGNKPIRVYWTGGTDFTSAGNLFQPPPDWNFWRTKNREGVADAFVPADLHAFLKMRNPPYQGI